MKRSSDELDAIQDELTLRRARLQSGKIRVVVVTRRSTEEDRREEVARTSPARTVRRQARSA